MDRLFYPRSVAVIGVSENPGNLARIIVRNLLEFHFAGDILLVGSKEGVLFERKIHTSLDQFRNRIDLAVILTPALTVPDIMESCGKRGIRRVIIESGGFSEYSEEGRALEERVLQIAKKWKIRLCGPNGIGIINMENGFVAPFVAMKAGWARTGDVSILAQSGGVSVAYFNLLSGANVGIAKMVSMGNKLDLDEIDYLRYLVDDPKTRIIGLYLESLEKGKELMEIARSSPKPIVLHKANTGEGSRQIARLHTAALANDDRVVDAASKQAGIIRVKEFRSFINILKIFTLPPMKGRNLMILSRSGGIAIIAADAAERYGFRLFPLKKSFQNRVHGYFRAKVIQPTNPLDLGDLFDFDLYTKILEQVLKIDAVDGVLFQHGATGVERESSRKLISAVKELSSRYQKPVALCYVTDDQELTFVKRAIDYPIFAEPEDALSVLAASVDHHHTRNRPTEKPLRYDVNQEAVKRLLQRARREKRDLLLPEAFEILRAYRIPVADYRVVNRMSAIEESLEALGKPLVLKAVSPELSHKSDAGGVILDIRDLSGAKEAYHKISRLISGKSSAILAQTTVSSGTEVILGATRDPSFGPVLLFGLGGIYVEIFQDHSLRVAPISRSEAREMILESRASKILRGARGKRPLDVDALVEILLKLSQLMMDFREIRGIDINPLKALETGAVALDARVLLK